jgi:hypothetical protein
LIKYIKMKNVDPHPELEFELLEPNVVSAHWSKDILFLEDEIRFFKNTLVLYGNLDMPAKRPLKRREFDIKIAELQVKIDAVKEEIPTFLGNLEPYIGNVNNGISISLVEEFSVLDEQIRALFSSVKETKGQLFIYIEFQLTNHNNYNRIISA